MNDAPYTKTHKITIEKLNYLSLKIIRVFTYFMFENICELVLKA